MSVSREEIDRKGVIYTVDTLTRMKAQMPQAEFHYLIGADTVHQLHTWRRVDELIHLCGFLVMMRPGEEEEKTLLAMQDWRKKGAQLALLEGRLLDISSSEIRKRLKAEKNADDLIPPAVSRYIREHHLYEAEEKP